MRAIEQALWVFTRAVDIRPGTLNSVLEQAGLKK